MSDRIQIEPIIGWPAYCDEIMSLLSLTQLEVSNLKVEVVDLTDALDEQGRTADARKVVIEQRDDRIATLEAENDRMRKALEEVQSAQLSNHGCMATILSDISKIAAAALEAKP